ncbi:MAG: peptide chain release factor N(5)-glutamine methyltransferase [Gammaproteobacteria bacterium]|nr:peptide chain release factor N(5)-glutamine methyltransferase [Gammaproteobacteria bacterium]MDH3446541.1 peptide chain release factor N(5)-glutamine methyltransferase [Gammaproteobacteria bacterium]
MSEQIDTALRWAAEQMETCSDSARLDAELLLSHCLEKPRSYLYSWPAEKLSDSCWLSFRALVHRRLEPTPVAYLLGKREFFSMEFATSPAALVPRPETELLVELALNEIPLDQPLRVCDLGTGAGVIAIALKKNRPRLRVYATDVDPACLALARDNALTHGVEIDFIESDWYAGLAPGSTFDLIVSNPPYIAADHPFLTEGDLPAEPAIALSPGNSGLEAIDTIVGESPRYLAPGGVLLIEHGYDQQAAVADLLQARDFVEIRCAFDHNDLPRVSRGRLDEPGR